MLAPMRGRQSSGYFTFREPDSELREKYVANIPIKAPTKDRVPPTVSAQTYGVEKDFPGFIKPRVHG